MPGLGQFYCREWKKGAAFLAGAWIMDAGLGISASFMQVLQGARTPLRVDEATGILLRSLPFLALALWSVLDAVRAAKHTAPQG